MMTNTGNRVTQGQFSFLPDLTDAQITAQIKYALKNGWAVSVEYTDDPHPRNTYWELFGMPMFDLKDPAGILMEIDECRKTFPNHYVRVMAFNSARGIESPAMSFIVTSPPLPSAVTLAKSAMVAWVMLSINATDAAAPTAAVPLKPAAPEMKSIATLSPASTAALPCETTVASPISAVV